MNTVYIINYNTYFKIKIVGKLSNNDIINFMNVLHIFFHSKIEPCSDKWFKIKSVLHGDFITTLLKYFNVNIKRC